MPVRRTLRAVNGETENPGAPPTGAPADITFGNSSYIQLTDAEKVEAWVSSSNARPLRFLVVLHRANRTAQTPAPDSFSYFMDMEFDVVDLPAEDSDHNENACITKTGQKVAMPRADTSFQKLLRKLEFRILRDRQEAALTHISKNKIFL